MTISVYAGVIFFIIIFSISFCYSQEIPLRLSLDEIELNSYMIMPETLLYKLMNNNDDFVLYDVRKPEQFRKKHIKGALNLPWDSQEFQTKIESYPSEKEIIIISEDGTLSLKAVRFLVERGFDSVSSVEGGMANWLYAEYIE